MMEEHPCRLCFKSFANGRALGGHMRSHSTTEVQEEVADHSASSPGQEEEEEKSLCYELRENPRRSFRVADPEFSFAIDAASLVDRESESETSKHLTRRRSKRTRPLIPTSHNHKSKKLTETHPESSLSETTTEEDLAFCLIMLSRDSWTRKNRYYYEEDEDDDFDSQKFAKKSIRGKYYCETCNKCFPTYQALGGHRASHNKIKQAPLRSSKTTSSDHHRTHECPVCYRVFSSGQALGGHKRSHIVSANSGRSVRNFIDLNLPAPIDDDEFNQTDLSALSAEEVSKNSLH